jgi:hypothetical protein
MSTRAEILQLYPARPEELSARFRNLHSNMLNVIDRSPNAVYVIPTEARSLSIFDYRVVNAGLSQCINVSFHLGDYLMTVLSTHDMCFSVLEKVLTYRKPKVQGVSYLCFLRGGRYENTEQIKSGCFPKRDQPNFSMLVL